MKSYGAAAADWESGAIAWVAQRCGVRCLILRGVTDLVDSSGGEAYGEIEVFHSGTRRVMENLIHHLPAWLNALCEVLEREDLFTSSLRYFSLNPGDLELFREICIQSHVSDIYQPRQEGVMQVIQDGM
jgi:hypothetical protein